MTAPIKINYKIYQGSTFQEQYRWESGTKVYKPITGITKSAPVEITAEAHELKPGWRFRVTNVTGMKEINSGSESFYLASDISADTIKINSVNSLAFSNYTGNSGVIEYNEPVDLTGYRARMQIREKVGSDVVIDELTTENGKIIIDAEDATIRIEIPADTTQNYNFTTAVYSLEIIRNSVVIPFLVGNLTLQREVTR